MMKLTTGILKRELKLGVVSSINASSIKVNLSHAGEISAAYMDGNRYGRGEVGEIILVEGQQKILLGRLTEVRLPDRERTEISQNFSGSSSVDAIGDIKLLGSICINSLKIEAGVSAYPRLGDRVFSAPSEFIASIPQLMNADTSQDQEELQIELGEITGEVGCKIRVSPEELFGRHCAILGSTGGGKSWTTAKIIEECSKFPKSKIILIDATSEYRSLHESFTEHFHLGNPINTHEDSKEIRIPPTDFDESDFIAMFDPSGKVQGPKLKEAIKSLRLAMLAPDLFPLEYIPKINQSKQLFRSALNRDKNSTLVDNPSQPFNVTKLVRQIVEECCWDNDDKWGAPTNDLGYCSSLLTRIQAVTHSTSLASVFNKDDDLKNLDETFTQFLSGDKNVLRLCCSDVSYEFYAREIIANVIGRKLLNLARQETFRKKPLLVILDEAHNFLGKRVGAEDHSVKLNSFELIAKEGRKYGLNICLATQRPRDITDGVLSQMGTLLVHRLTNDKDRDVVERACGEIDKSSASFLPNLKQGEVAIVGVNFPIPMTVQMDRPSYPPKSDGPKFRECWA
jgi:DNA helicase HerA-like ATPase